MIIIDIETGGLKPIVNPLLSIGAVSMNPHWEFYGVARMRQNQQVSEEALKINGFERRWFDPRDPEYRWVDSESDIELYLRFLRWLDLVAANEGEDYVKVIGGHNCGGFDVPWLKAIHETYMPKAFRCPLPYRTVDLHTLGYAAFGKSMSHKDICLALGLEPEPEPHNALAGAKSERDAIKLLLERFKQ